MVCAAIGGPPPGKRIRHLVQWSIVGVCPEDSPLHYAGGRQLPVRGPKFRLEVEQGLLRRVARQWTSKANGAACIPSCAGLRHIREKIQQHSRRDEPYRLRSTVACPARGAANSPRSSCCRRTISRAMVVCRTFGRRF